MDIKSSSIDVHLDVFEGPLDLLLYLIRKNNLDIYDIPISSITQEYLSYLDVMKDLNLEMAGEFLVMASTLMQIKSRLLLPSQQQEEEESGPDPRAELAARLTEYQKYKEAAKILDSRFEQFKNVFYRGTPVFSEAEKYLDLEFFDLIEAVKSALERSEDKGQFLERESFPIELKIDKILTMLRERKWILLYDIFSDERKKMGIITCFMALLELIKGKKIIARQDAVAGEVRVYLRPEEATQET
ncbi:MAG: segregation/condensation protein A [bacterium]